MKAMIAILCLILIMAAGLLCLSDQASTGVGAATLFIALTLTAVAGEIYYAGVRRGR